MVVGNYLVMNARMLFLCFSFLLFYKRNRKHPPPCSHTLEKHSWKFGRTRNTCPMWARVPTSISRSPKLPLVFLLTVWKLGKCFLFLKKILLLFVRDKSPQVELKIKGVYLNLLQAKFTKYSKSYTFQQSLQVQNRVTKMSRQKLSKYFSTSLYINVLQEG